MPTILHPWARTRDEQQVETLRFLLSLEPRHYFIRTQECLLPTDYATFLRKSFALWSTPIFIVEQDIAPTQKQIDELMECYENVCVIPYKLREGSASIWEWDRVSENSFTNHFYEEPYPEFADNTSLGFIKFSRGAVNRIAKRIDTSVHWSMIDAHISALLTLEKIPIHVHKGEVVHNRTKGDLRG